jgi:hypothetical protein
MVTKDRSQRTQLDAVVEVTRVAKRRRHLQATTTTTASSHNGTQVAPMHSSNTSNRAATPSADDILVGMVQAGGYSHQQVVYFCISSGIPLSRMLRLDLMRLNKAQQNMA